jgi:hypothetical protein
MVDLAKYYKRVEKNDDLMNKYDEMVKNLGQYFTKTV